METGFIKGGGGAIDARPNRRAAGYGARLAGFIAAGAVGLAALGFAAALARAADPPDNLDTVIWISMDGMRSDYLDRGPLPFFQRMMREGASTRRSRPTFPSITFPSHCSQATGVGVDEHGVPGNGFYDISTRQRYAYPNDSALLQAEPIWLTASRQNVRALVSDWPLSQQEKGPVRAAYFKAKFDPAVTDEQRLTDVLATWRADQAALRDQPPPRKDSLRLLMGYVVGTDSDGHKYGPDAPEIGQEMSKLDRELGAFQEQALALWKTGGGAGHVYFLFTTDHGMSKVEKTVDIDKLLGLPHGQTEIAVSSTGSIGSVFFDGIADPARRRARENEMLTALRAQPFVRVFRREELPPAWRYAHPTRVGDLVVLLTREYTFGKLQPEAVMDIAQTGVPKGMHGYPVDDDPEMYGPLILWRYPDPFGGKDLGDVDWSQLHPTVAKLLGIRPADAARGRPIELPR